MLDFELEMELDNLIEAIAEQAETKQKSQTKIINFARLSEMLQSARILKALFLDAFEDDAFDIAITSDYGCGVIRLEKEDFVVKNPKLFNKAIKPSDNFEIYPLLNGKIRVTLMYYNLFVKIG